MGSLSVSSSLPSLPNLDPSSTSTTPGKRKKYYVVTAGRCAGVFDNWFVYFFLPVLVIHSGWNRPYVQSLTSGVSGNCHKSYVTHDEALRVYQEMKAKGLVRVIRDPGDEYHFGSIEDAVQ